MVTCTYPPYEVRRYGWGYFTIRAVIVLKRNYRFVSAPAGLITRAVGRRQDAAVEIEWTLDFDGKGSLESHVLMFGREPR